MKAPISWLKDFVDIELTPAALATKLVNAGFEVDEIICQSDEIKNVRAGKILQIEKHPNADKLRVCKVDVGSSEVQIVTNATNVFVGAVVPVALDGSLLPSGKEIFAGELRGVKSDGMFTGIEDLKADESNFPAATKDGVLILPENVAAGTDMAEVLGLDDVILDVSVTANRPDCNSIIGIAREIAAVTDKKVKEPNLGYKTSDNAKNPISVEVKNTDLCPRYMAHSVKNVKIAPSPAYIKKRLKAVGIRPINNIVDITNYVLIELGQPMHAFDRRFIGGDKITVRNATDGEKIVTLDGKNNTLTADMLVICDENKPMAVAGVMGGENSGIADDTTEIVFESAKFARDSVRRTSKALTLRSDSSARFEKGIDFASQEIGLKRALSLICELSAGEVYGGSVDVCVPYEHERTLTFPIASIKKILGIRIATEKVISILNSLSIETVVDGKNYVSKLPAWRDDLENANDMAEEVIRICGYGKVKSTFFKDCQQTAGGTSKAFKIDGLVRTALAGVGACEAVTYSFVSPKSFELLRLPEDSPLRVAVPLRNPLGEDVSIMRTTLVPSMLNVLKTNITKFTKAGRFFEIAKRYIPKALPITELPTEKQTLVIGAYGEKENFFTLKGMVESMASALKLTFGYRAAVYPYMHDGRCAEILEGGRVVGVMGEIHPDVQEAVGVDERLYIAEIELALLTEKALSIPKFTPIPKFPPMSRDLAVVVLDSVNAGDMLDQIKKSSKLLGAVTVFDVYKGAHIKKGYKSIAFSLEFRNFERTLTDDEIAAEMTAILSALNKKFKAKLRA